MALVETLCSWPGSTVVVDVVMTGDEARVRKDRQVRETAGWPSSDTWLHEKSPNSRYLNGNEAPNG